MKFSINKDIKDITKEDLESLVKNRVPEDKFLDFKAQNYGTANGDKRELLKDVSAFANAEGGELIIGINEDEFNQAKELCGITSKNIADDVSRLEQIIQSGLEPKLDNFRIRYIELGNGKYVIIIRVEHSPLFPHMISFQRTNKFYMRKSDRNLMLDAYELKNVFLKSSNISENIREQNKKIVDNVFNENTLVPLVDGPKIILNFIPYSAIMGTNNLDISNIDINLGMTDQRINFDGILAFQTNNIGIDSYCQLHRNGILEYVSSSNKIFGKTTNPFTGDEINIIWGDKNGYEFQLIKQVLFLIKIIKNLKIPAPIYLFLSILNTKGYRIFYKDTDKNPKLTNAIDRNVLSFPELELKDYSGKKPAIQDLFNMVWNACGERKSINFSVDGSWLGEEIKTNLE